MELNFEKLKTFLIENGEKTVSEEIPKTESYTYTINASTPLKYGYISFGYFGDITFDNKPVKVRYNASSDKIEISEDDSKWTEFVFLPYHAVYKHVFLMVDNVDEFLRQYEKTCRDVIIEYCQKMIGNNTAWKEENEKKLAKAQRDFGLAIEHYSDNIDKLSEKIKQTQELN